MFWARSTLQQITLFKRKATPDKIKKEAKEEDIDDFIDA